MKLYEVFNENYLSFLNILHKSFNEHRLLLEELKRTQNIITQDESTSTLHNNFQKNITQDNIDKIYSKDESVLKEIFKKIRLSDLFDRMYKCEKNVFWDNLQNLCRYSSMIRACGSQLNVMENMATDFMENNQNVNPKEYHMKLFKEMLSGGEMSQQLLSTFSEPDSINNILTNVGNIMKNTDGKKEKTFVDLFGSSFSKEDVEEVSKEMKKINETK